VPIRKYLVGHEIVISAEIGWERLKNGELLAAAEAQRFELLLTTDKNIGYRQNLKDRVIAVFVIGHAQWPGLKPNIQRVVDAVCPASPSGYYQVEIPYGV